MHTIMSRVLLVITIARTSYAPLKAFNPLKRQPLRSPSDQSSGEGGRRSSREAKEVCASVITVYEKFLPEVFLALHSTWPETRFHF